MDTVKFKYDNDGLLASLVPLRERSELDASRSGLTNVGNLALSYNAQNGLLTGTTLGNVTTSQGYSNYGELSSYTANYNSSPIFQTTYSRDSLGRITTLNETELGIAKQMDYSYDTVGRLQKVWRNDTLVSQYVYDANGNRIAHITPTQIDSGTYDAQDRMLRYAGAQYFYGRNGDLQTKIAGTDTTKYTYDALGNLTQVVMPNGDVIQYVIDGQNRRIAKKVNGQIARRWIYSGQLSPIAELDSAGNIVTRFVASYMTKGGNTYRLITDYLGSIRLVVDANSGTVVQKIDYDEFGNVIYDSNPGFQPLGFAGGLYDADTKLVRFGLRDYDAEEGRWTSKDLIKFAGGASNIYEYSLGDPINLFDYNGLQPFNAWIGRIVHKWVLMQLSIRLGPERAIMKPGKIPGAGRYGKDGIPDLMLILPNGEKELYELKSAQTLQNDLNGAQGQIQTYCDVSGNKLGTSLNGSPALDAPFELGPYDVDVSYYGPGLLQYQISLDKAYSPQEIYNTLKGLSFVAAAKGLLNLSEDNSEVWEWAF